jgi:hypothetical protein
MKSFIFLTFCIYFAFSSESWFVSPSKGNDSNFGRKNSPFKTFERAYNVTSNGDTIMLEKDTYFFRNSKHYSKDLKVVGIPEGNNLPVLIGIMSIHAEHISFENVKFETSDEIISHYALWVVGCNSLLLRNVIFNHIKSSQPHSKAAFRIGGRGFGKLEMNNVQFFNYNQGDDVRTTAQFQRTGPNKPALLTISNVSFFNSSGLAIYEYENVIVKDLTMSDTKTFLRNGALTIMSTTKFLASGVVIHGGENGISILRSAGIIENSIFSRIGKMAIESSNSKFSLENSVLFGNHANETSMIDLIGSSIEMNGGKMVHNSAQNGILVNCDSVVSKFTTNGTLIQGNVGRINCQ